MRPVSLPLAINEHTSRMSHEPKYPGYPHPNAPPPYGAPPPGAPPVVVVQVPVGPEPMSVPCPYCNALITTTVEYVPSTSTHLFALLLCLIFPICCCVPYCCNSCQTAVHTCPNCKRLIGTTASN